jgi:hypothetical protein
MLKQEEESKAYADSCLHGSCDSSRDCDCNGREGANGRSINPFISLTGAFCIQKIDMTLTYVLVTVIVVVDLVFVIVEVGEADVIKQEHAELIREAAKTSRAESIGFARFLSA